MLNDIHTHVRRGAGLLALLILPVATGWSGTALAVPNAAGDLDPTFGSGGIVTTAFPVPTGSNAYSMATQVDGKRILAGSAHSRANGDDFALARYTISNTLDTTFGTGGKVTTDFAGHDEGITTVAVQGDGKIVAAGYSWASPAQIALARYLSNGSLDPTFGTAGKVTTDLTTGAIADALVLQADGKIVGSYALWLIRSFVPTSILLQHHDRFLAGCYKYIQRGIIMIHGPIRLF